MSEKHEQIPVKKIAILHNGSTADGDIYDTVLKLAQGAIDYISSCSLFDGNEEFTTEMFCGDDQWSMWTNDEKRTAGRCLVSMAMTRILPLEIIECVGRKHATPTRFRIKK